MDKCMKPKDVAQKLEEGRLHLSFMASIYREQHRWGRHFIHERMASAFSWREDEIVKLMGDPHVHEVVCDQCQFGLTTRGATKDEQLPAMKPTRFISSSKHTVKQLERRCDRSHKHQHLAGGCCADAAFYPLPLIRPILKGIKATAEAGAEMKSEVQSKQYMSAMATGEQPSEVSEVTEIPHCFVKRYKSGAKVHIELEEGNLKRQYLDECTGDVLQHNLIKDAIIEELTYFCEKEFGCSRTSIL